MRKQHTKARPARPELSFVTERDKKTRKLTDHGCDWWSVTAAGDYAADCNTGVQLAEEFLRHLNRNRELCRTSELGWIVRDMIAKGRFTGLEVGFFSRISRACPDHPFLRLTADQSVPPFTEALFEEHCANQTRAHRERMNKSA
jgi:hypothetical protein